MPDFQDVEDEAKSHGKEADEGVGAADKLADEHLGGGEKSAVDKGAQEAERALGGDGGAQTPPSSTP